MSDLRTAAQQALEALEHATPTTDWSYMITALRAALARQDEPVAYTTGHCENHKQKGGCQLHNLQCGWPDCDRKPTTASSQQAEPVEPHRWEGDNNIKSPFNACMHKTYCMTLKQAEPLNLSDPAVQKRLASQWGYVPAAAQAEPVEPVAWMFELARNFNLEGYGGWEKRITEYRPNTPEGSVRNVTPLYTAPSQRKPLTEKEIKTAFHAA